MKKKELTRLRLHKKSISILKIESVKGGCPSNTCRTRDAGCVLSFGGACQ